MLGWVGLFVALGARRETRALAADVSSLRGLVMQRLNPVEPASAPGESAEAARPSPAPSEGVAGDAAPAFSVDAPETPAARAPRASWEKDKPRPAATAEQVRIPAPSKPPRRLLEASLSGNWLLWLGGAALVLGGAFLLKSAIDAGLFGPVFRVAAALAAGGAMIAAAQRLKRGAAERESLAPSILAGAGGATIYGAIYAAYGLYGLIPSPLAFALLVAASAGAIVLAVIHRRAAMAGLALVGAFMSPALTATDDPSLLALLFYVLGVAGAGLAAARLMQWRSIAWVALAGGLIWPALSALSGAPDAGLPLSLYLPAFLALAASIASDEAKAPIDGGAIMRRALRGLPLSLAAFFIAAAGAVLIGVIVADSGDWPVASACMFAAFAAVSLFLAARREGFAAAPVLTAAGTALALQSAPYSDQSIFAGAAFAAAYGLGGAWLASRTKEKGPAASAAAFAPILILGALYAAAGAAPPAPAWGAVAFGLAFVNIFALNRLAAMEGGLDRHPGAASACALGAVLSASLAVAFSTEGLAMGALLALQAPAIALLWRRFKLPALLYAAGVVGAISTLRLFFSPALDGASAGGWPIFNALIPSYCLPAIGFWFAERWFIKGGAQATSPVVQAMGGGAVALFAAFVTLEIRHALNGGDLSADYGGLLEISLQTISWVSIAAFLRWRFGADLTVARQVVERVLLGLAAAQSIFGPLLALNPWWGSRTQFVAGPPVFNLLLLYYLAPALAFGAAALVARRGGLRWQARIPGALAALMGYVGMILLVRHAFHAPLLQSGGIGERESWGYSIATIIFASAILVVGAMRRSAMLRFAGLGALMLAVLKVFLHDMAALEGLWRATSFLGLGAALIGIAVLYQRVLASARDTPAQNR